MFNRESIFIGFTYDEKFLENPIFALKNNLVENITILSHL